MTDQDDSEFLARLLETFRIEAEEHFEVLSNGLLELERDPDGQHLPLVETLFREAHSLKGAARAVELGPARGVRFGGGQVPADRRVLRGQVPGHRGRGQHRPQLRGR